MPGSQRQGPDPDEPDRLRAGRGDIDRSQLGTTHAGAIVTVIRSVLQVDGTCLQGGELLGDLQMRHHVWVNQPSDLGMLTPYSTGSRLRELHHPPLDIDPLAVLSLDV